MASYICIWLVGKLTAYHTLNQTFSALMQVRIISETYQNMLVSRHMSCQSSRVSEWELMPDTHKKHVLCDCNTWPGLRTVSLSFQMQFHFLLYALQISKICYASPILYPCEDTHIYPLVKRSCFRERWQFLIHAGRWWDKRNMREGTVRSGIVVPLGWPAPCWPEAGCASCQPCWISPWVRRPSAPNFCVAGASHAFICKWLKYLLYSKN